MPDKNLQYPVILTEHNDESGHYYVVTSPNLQGLVTDGKTIREALYNAQDAILCLLDGEKYPEVQNPYLWKLKEHQDIFWVQLTGKIKRLKDMPSLQELVECEPETLVLNTPKTVILDTEYGVEKYGFTCYYDITDYLLKDRLPANDNNLDKLAKELEITPQDFVENLGDYEFYYYYVSKVYKGIPISDWVHEQGYDCE